MDKFNEIAVVDLFCGVGGLTRGFLNQGLNVTAGVDIDGGCEYAYEKNNKVKFIHQSVSDIKSEDLDNLFSGKKYKILVGCAPCQPFSIFNRKNKGKISDKNSDRWKLLYSFAEHIKNIKPDIISMENVPLLQKFQNGEVFQDFVNSLKKQNYFVYHEVHDAQEYGVPQRRKRLVLLASLHGPIEMIKPTHKTKIKTVYKAIGKLPPIEAGEVDPKDPLHRSRKLGDLAIKRIKATPEGGGWKDWDNELVAECHKKDGGKAFGSAYGRMSWDNVSPTITTYCVGYNNGKFGHPTQNRAISLREAAILQSFPKNYNFINPKVNFSSSQIAKQIGNAVPVILGEAIAKSIRRHIEEYNTVNE